MYIDIRIYAPSFLILADNYLESIYKNLALTRVKEICRSVGWIAFFATLWNLTVPLKGRPLYSKGSHISPEKRSAT